MRRFFLILGALAIAAIPIAFVLLKAPAIDVKRLPRMNPTSSVFHASVEEVFSKVAGPKDACHSLDFYPAGVSQIESITGKKLRIAEATLVTRTDHDPIGKSKVYFARGEALDYLAEFELHLIERGGKETEVRVRTLRPEVINGKKLGFGSCGPGLANRYVAVEPTTIEEYEILLRIGQALGEKDMPPLVLPQ